MYGCLLGKVIHSSTRDEVASAILFFSSGSSTITKLHGCALHAEGAKRATQQCVQASPFTVAHVKPLTLCLDDTEF